MWVVVLKRPASENVWAPGYFPRLFRYKKDADRLAAEVRAKGGRVEVSKAYGPARATDGGGEALKGCGGDGSVHIR